MFPTAIRITAKTSKHLGTNREHLEACITAELTGRHHSCQEIGNIYRMA
jgi:hypothetical protein